MPDSFNGKAENLHAGCCLDANMAQGSQNAFERTGGQKIRPCLPDMENTDAEYEMAERIAICMFDGGLSEREATIKARFQIYNRRKELKP